MTLHVLGRVVSYLVLLLIALVGLAPFAFLVVLSFKSRLEILDVPPSRHFDWAQIKENYNVVIHERGFVTFIRNSVVVTGASTLIALALGVGSGLSVLLAAFPLPILAGMLAAAGLLHIGLLRDLRGGWAWALALSVGVVGLLVNLALALALGLLLWWLPVLLRTPAAAR